jgi:cellulose synthase/poly-beta-1,6-N-acetylglucosamine synthase-like glycosyltransferase
MAEWIFWMAVGAVGYAYAGYPLLLAVLARVTRRAPAPATAEAVLPAVSMIVPVHNERDLIEAKVRNTRELEYPADRLEVIFVSDGSTDGTTEYLREQADARIRLLALEMRGGKGAALNAGREAARHDILVFSDASIMLDPDAVARLVGPFADPGVGCVSGEDRIAGGGGEGLYGRYELHLRRQESRVRSIVGASGSFYAQRRALCDAFPPNLAPDFFSVLRTVEQGSRAITQPGAGGEMTALHSTADEFHRKVRTILRGITTLMRHAGLMNPFRYGLFAVALLSHKLMRWLVPFFLLAALVAHVPLALQSRAYAVLFVAHAGFYLSAALPLLGLRAAGRLLPVRIAVYFTTVNLATLVAWLRYAAGTRQEIWNPTRRPAGSGEAR